MADYGSLFFVTGGKRSVFS